MMCHCGERVYSETHDEDAWQYSPYMAQDYCYECVMVRCDAYPGACDGSYHVD